MNEIIGFDCDGNQLFENMVVRAIWYSDIDFDIETDVDPRQYCVIRGEDNKYYLISVWDWYNKEAIKRYEGIEGDIPVIVKDIKESENYEVATDCDGNIIYYDLDINQLNRTLSNILKTKKREKQKKLTK